MIIIVATATTFAGHESSGRYARRLGSWRRQRRQRQRCGANQLDFYLSTRPL